MWLSFTTDLAPSCTEYTKKPDAPAVFEGYKRRSLVLGKAVNILAPGKDPVPAEVLDLMEDYSLLVRLPDGSETRLNSGEVSVRVDNGE